MRFWPHARQRREDGAELLPRPASVSLPKRVWSVDVPPLCLPLPLPLLVCTERSVEPRTSATMASPACVHSFSKDTLANRTAQGPLREVVHFLPLWNVKAPHSAWTRE